MMDRDILQRQKEYMGWTRSLTGQELALREELMSWLPTNLIDCHSHFAEAAHVTSIDPRARRHMMSTFPIFTISDSREIDNLLFPGKRIRRVRFPHVFPGIMFRSANASLLDKSPEADRVAVFGLGDDLSYTEAILRHPRSSALKMYPMFLTPPAKRIYEFFPPPILELAQSLDRPIILHLPAPLESSIDDVLAVAHDFPRLRIVLAHMGQSHAPGPLLPDAYAALVSLDNVVLDTSTINSARVIELALASIGPTRVMFGSDAPVWLVRATPYVHPRLGPRIATPLPYHWLDPAERAEFGHLGHDAMLLHWGSLDAIRTATRALHLGCACVEALFRDNAAAVFRF